MDPATFLFGALGALLTIYLAKQEVIPEFRPLFDTLEEEKEIKQRREHIKATEKHIDEIQARLAMESLSADLTKQLTTVLETSLDELRGERQRLQVLERKLVRGQLISRGLGFLFYVVLGGVFGSLLAGRVQVEGFNGDLPRPFQAVAIGATWTSYLSTIGFRSGQKKADERIEALRKEVAEKLDAFNKEVLGLIHDQMTTPEEAVQEENQRHAELAATVIEKFDLAKADVLKDLDFTREMVQRDVRGIL